MCNILKSFEGIRVTSRHKQEFENFFLLVATRNLDRRSFGHESRLIRPCPNAAESETVLNENGSSILIETIIARRNLRKLTTTNRLNFVCNTCPNGHITSLRSFAEVSASASTCVLRTQTKMQQQRPGRALRSTAGCQARNLPFLSRSNSTCQAAPPRNRGGGKVVTTNNTRNNTSAGIDHCLQK